jgi:surfeit locus 1 family protein
MGLISFFSTRRFAPTLWPTLGMAAFVALTVSLGNWQRHRAVEKQALATAFDVAAKQEPVELTGDERDPAALIYRPVRANGRYDSARQVLIDNRVHAGRPGFQVVTPLCFAPGRKCVLVDRGWVGQGSRRSDLPIAPPPEGAVTVTGRATLPPRRYLEFGSGSPTGPLWQNLDIERIAAATSLDLSPIVIEQANPVVPDDGLNRDWAPPEFGIDRHLSYMLQWYSFAAIAIVLWLTLNWRQRDGGASINR